MWFSWDAQRHDHIVSYEQRRQDVRQSLLESQLRFVEANSILIDAIKDEKKSERRETSAKLLSELTELRGDLDQAIKGVDQLPASAATQARLELERMAPAAIRISKKAHTLLQKVRADRSGSK
jgi:hypothetical protein